jgi:hypothetical protein
MPLLKVIISSLMVTVQTSGRARGPEISRPRPSPGSHRRRHPGRAGPDKLRGHPLHTTISAVRTLFRFARKRALPLVGYVLTKPGIRAAESPIDRVLAHPESKVPAVTEIVQTEAADLGPGLRALVLCEFESVGGMVPTRLAGVIDPKADGAVLALTPLPESAPELDPVLLTGQRVACGPEPAENLLGWLGETDPGLVPRVSAPGPVMEVSAGTSWEPRRYVPLITRFFTTGGTRCLGRHPRAARRGPGRPPP